MKLINLLQDWKTYKKAIIAQVLVLATWAVASLADGHISLSEWIALIPAILSGPGVFITSNNAPAQGQ